MEDDINILREISSLDFNEKVFQTSLSFNALAQLINRAVSASLETHLKNLGTVQKEEKDNLLSIEETADFFGVSLVTIHSWKKEGKLQGFKRIGGRVYIHESDCLASMKEIKLSKRRS